MKSSQISNLAKDLAPLATVSVRVVEIIPGKPYVGPRSRTRSASRRARRDREVAAYDDLEVAAHARAGKDIGGQPVCADLQRMPHLLIAGTTGSGKPVALNAMVLSSL